MLKSRYTCTKKKRFACIVFNTLGLIMLQHNHKSPPELYSHPINFIRIFFMITVVFQTAMELNESNNRPTA